MKSVHVPWANNTQDFLRAFRSHLKERGPVKTMTQYTLGNDRCVWVHGNSYKTTVHGPWKLI